MEVYIKSSSTAKDYFDQGMQFLEAAWRCFGKKTDKKFYSIELGKFQQLSAPCAVNAAFACEMFLKSLLNKLKIKYNRNTEGHNLYLLYKKLPSNAQNIIAKSCGKKTDTTVFEQWIKNHANDFVNIRYFIERNEWTRMSPMMMLTVAENLSTISAYLLDNTDWEEML